MKTFFKALSVLSAVLCVLLCVLWMRSYRWEDELCLSIPGTPRVRFISVPSRVHISLRSGLGNSVLYWNARRWNGDGSGVLALTQRVSQRYENVLGFGIRQKSGRTQLTVPHWFLVVATAALAAVPWIKLQFSLRTLLVAMTIIAVVLALIEATIG